MDWIYGTADKVHVWLGPAIEEDHVQAVFNAFKEKAVASDNYIRHNERIRVATMREPVSTATLIASSSFLSRLWFTRRWVLQEVALSRVVTIRCGHQKLAWEWFCVGTKLLSDACEIVEDRMLYEHLAPNVI
jgi:hypothetical protein